MSSREILHVAQHGKWLGVAIPSNTKAVGDIGMFARMCMPRKLLGAVLSLDGEYACIGKSEVVIMAHCWGQLLARMSRSESQVGGDGHHRVLRYSGMRPMA